MSIKAKLTAIADALRSVLGTSGKYTLAQMPGLINSLSSNYKTSDIYCNIFKFNVAEYGESLVYNQYEWSPIYCRTDITIPYKKEFIVNYFPKASGNAAVYYIAPARTYENRRLRAILPRMVDYIDGDTYADASGTGVEYDSISLYFANFNNEYAKLDSLRLTEHFKFRYSDITKNYSCGIALAGNNNINSAASGYLYTTHRDCYNQIGSIEIREGKLYLVSGISTTEPVEICGVDPDVNYDITLQLVHDSKDRDEYNKVINKLDYTLTIVNEDDAVSAEYSDVVTYSTTYGILQNVYSTYSILGIYSPANRPEKCHWYSFELSGKRYSNVLINPIVSYSEDTLYEITDDNAPGMKYINTDAFNPVVCTNLHRINCTAITEVAPYAVYQSTAHVSNFVYPYNFHSQLNEIVLPNVTTISEYAFANSGCRDIGSSSSGKSMPYMAIAKLDIRNVINIKSYAFYGTLINYFKPLTLNRLSTLGAYAFAYSTITKFIAPILQTIGTYAVTNNYALEHVDLPECTSLGTGSFEDCVNLRYMNLPKATKLPAKVFSGIFIHPGDGGRVFNLPEVVEITGSDVFYQLNLGISGVFDVLPKLTKISDGNTFKNAIISKITLPALTDITQSAKDTFANIANLKELRLPVLQNVDIWYYSSTGIFSNLIYKAPEFDVDVIAPNLTTYGPGMFCYIKVPVVKSSKLINIYPADTRETTFGWSKINQLYLYSVPYFSDEFCERCTGLELIYTESLYTIGHNSYARHFDDCINLRALILAGTEAVCSLSNTNSFTDTPIAGWQPSYTVNNNAKYKVDDGYIYVPKSLIEDYKVAPNWATYAHKFRAIEDYGGLEGIKRLIYPEYTHSCTVTNSELLSDALNTSISNLDVGTSQVTSEISNIVNDIDLYHYTGDDSDYVVFSRPNVSSYGYRNSKMFIPQLPPVKDFTLEFDIVLNGCYPAVIFGMKKLPTDNSEINDTYLRSPSSYEYFVGSGSVYRDVCISTASNGRSQCVGSNDGMYNHTYAGSVESDLTWRGDLTNIGSTHIFYNGEKVHVKMVRAGRTLRMYLNGMLQSIYTADELQARPGGYFGLCMWDSTQRYTYGITNLVLKYNNVWTDPPATEVWISSVNWTDMTSTIDGVDTVLTKNSHGYYVLDISQLSGSETSWVLSSTDGASSTLDANNLATYAGKIIDVYGTTVTVYE